MEISYKASELQQTDGRMEIQDFSPVSPSHELGVNNHTSADFDKLGETS
jgi:hypothetical protein